MKQVALLLLSLPCLTSALDLEFDSIQCDTKLPAYAEENGITMTCNGSTRCTMGDSAVISGEMIYNGLEDYSLSNTTGFSSAKLQLMTLEYDLFQFLPFNFCGEWIENASYNYQECPEDGVYHFEIPYQLPETEGISAWFASGWEGISYLKIYGSESDQSAMLTHCKLHFKTYVTDTGEENWYTLPSAATATIILFSILGCLFMTVLCLACRPRKKHPTDDDYGTTFKAMEDKVTVAREEDAAQSMPLTEFEEKAHQEQARRIAQSMKYQGV